MIFNFDNIIEFNIALDSLRSQIRKEKLWKFESPINYFNFIVTLLKILYIFGIFAIIGFLMEYIFIALLYILIILFPILFIILKYYQSEIQNQN